MSCCAPALMVPSRHTSTHLPKIVLGTSCLGNLYRDIGYDAKRDIIVEVILQNKLHNINNLIFDSAGKYGCGLALETLGSILKELHVQPSEVRISNKLGWRRVPFDKHIPNSCSHLEPGVWVGMEYDAVMDISYDGILRCFQQGNQLLGEYSATMVSVHDPDDYLDESQDIGDRERRANDVVAAYECLNDLKSQNKVESIGIGVKNTAIIELLLDRGVVLDWTMIAGVLTPFVHTLFTRTLLGKLHRRGIEIINAAVFNSGFLVGENHFNYVHQDPHENPSLFAWRRDFFHFCDKHNVTPAHACVQFSFLFSGVSSVALNACSPDHVALNFKYVRDSLPSESNIWKELAEAKLIHGDIV